MLYRVFYDIFILICIQGYIICYYEVLIFILFYLGLCDIFLIKKMNKKINGNENFQLIYYLINILGNFEFELSAE